VKKVKFDGSVETLAPFLTCMRINDNTVVTCMEFGKKEHRKMCAQMLYYVPSYAFKNERSAVDFSTCHDQNYIITTNTFSGMSHCQSGQ
jgi:hypothetical protein